MEFEAYQGYNGYLLIFRGLDVKCVAYALSVKCMSTRSTVDFISIKQILSTNCTFNFVLVRAIHRGQMNQIMDLTGKLDSVIRLDVNDLNDLDGY